ncbi:hypothetical protein V866_001147 [Kwoniella sp. B9012]
MKLKSLFALLSFSSLTLSAPIPDGIENQAMAVDPTGVTARGIVVDPTVVTARGVAFELTVVTARAIAGTPTTVINKRQDDGGIRTVKHIARQTAVLGGIAAGGGDPGTDDVGADPVITPAV